MEVACHPYFIYAKEIGKLGKESLFLDWIGGVTASFIGTTLTNRRSERVRVLETKAPVIIPPNAHTKRITIA